MAAASPPTFPLAFLRLCYCLFFVVFIQHVPCATPLSFDINTATNPCDNELECKGNAYFNPPVIELTKNDRTVESSHSLGWVWYKQSVPLWDNATGEVASFNTTFSFQIKAEKQSSVGDGMAFFLSRFPPRCLNTSGGGNLGLYNDSDNLGATGDGRAVAVEFDTYSNSYESATQHVGIDVNSIQSVAYTDTSSTGRNLTSDITMVAMVKYDNETKLLNVDLQIGDVWYNVNATVDLKTKLPGEVAVGFSGATGVNAELHRVRSWKFSSSLEEKKALMAIPPAPALASQPRPVPGVKSEPSTKLLLKVLSPVALVSVSAIVAVLWLWQKRRRNVQPEKATTDSESDEPRAEADFERGVAGPRRYHYRDLAAATGYFAEDNKLGRGGFGSVYKGCLSMDDGQQLVAIKKFSLESSQGRKEFEAEVKIISRLRHRNLVQLLGWCDSLKGLLLVYELVEEGSLDKHIHNNERLLTWPDRYKIILGLGSALRYLHLEWEQCVVHGDIKPSNIMLDSLYNTKLGDFGLARLVDHGTGPQTTKHVQGTVGYIDPEFVNTLRRSTESDVYSFGIVLLEIVSGRQPVDRQEPSFMLLRWVYSLYSQGSTLDAANARLRGDEADERQMERVLVVGLWCAQHDPGQRPTVAQAMHVLQSEEAKLPALPPQMYKLVAPMSIAMGESSASGSSLSSGVRSSATTGTTRSSGSFAN